MELDGIMDQLIKTAEAGGKAKEFKSSGWYDWINETIFNALDEKAMIILRKAKDDPERMKAQMLSLSVHEIRSAIESIISSGDAAKQQISEGESLLSSTPNNGGENG